MLGASETLTERAMDVVAACSIKGEGKTEELERLLVGTLIIQVHPPHQNPETNNDLSLISGCVPVQAAGQSGTPQAGPDQGASVRSPHRPLPANDLCHSQFRFNLLWLGFPAQSPKDVRAAPQVSGMRRGVHVDLRAAFASVRRRQGRRDSAGGVAA
eukprot:368279-Rhodomonas_salina.2